MRRPLSALAVALAACVTIAGPARALTVDTSHPRFFLTGRSGVGVTRSEFVRRCSSDPAYSARCTSSLDLQGSYPAMNAAAAYVVRGDAASCTTAYQTLKSQATGALGAPTPHDFIVANGRTMVQLAVVLDWCDAALTSSERTWIQARIATLADWYVANPPADVFHNDMPNVWSAIGLAGLALAGTSEDAKARQYITLSDDQHKNVIFPAFAYERDFWHEGMVYVYPALGALTWHALAWTSATDENLFAYASANANDLFDGYLQMLAYDLRGDYRFFYFGDTADDKQTILGAARPFVDMLTTGTGSTLGQGLSIEIGANANGGDYLAGDGYLSALFYDATKDVVATPRASLPTARWLSPGAKDIAILRSGWGPDDTAIWMSCGDWMGSHDHVEAGSFQIFRRAILTGTDGYYDDFLSPHWSDYLAQHSVHANTLAVVDPNEIFPTDQFRASPKANVNDGGQRTTRMDSSGNVTTAGTLDAYLGQLTTGPHLETGNMVSFAQSTCHDYVACDVTAAYDSPSSATNGNGAKVSAVTRQLVFLPPYDVLVFDRVTSTNPAYAKRFLLHSQAPATVAGTTFTITNGAGTLFGQTLLPASPAIGQVGRFVVDGVAYPPSSTGVEEGGYRIEVAPSASAMQDYFLHVFDTSGGAPPSASVVEDDAGAEVTLATNGTSAIVTFTETGGLGGHVRVTSSDGGVVCDQDLGADAAPPPVASAPPEAGVSSDASAILEGPDASAVPAPDAGDATTTSAAPSRAGCAACSAGMASSTRGSTTLHPLLLFVVAALARRSSRKGEERLAERISHATPRAPSTPVPAPCDAPSAPSSTSASPRSSRSRHSSSRAERTAARASAVRRSAGPASRTGRSRSTPS
jgi:hypothetical protein